MNRLRELEVLKMRARKVEDRLRELNHRLARMEQRSAGPLFRPVVQTDRCKGCGTCEAVCPTGAVQVDKTARIDENRCVGCGRCADACPAKAIVLQRILPEEAKRIIGIS
ncbi:MAG: 4Fe-4S dicluster domain-containing protein [Desulfobacteraceae bacterium]|jgi:2-oxoacid:acceptor oxidoreductase delta subunit (pyruvate/2-ketoisovalerate family)